MAGKARAQDVEALAGLEQRALPRALAAVDVDGPRDGRELVEDVEGEAEAEAPSRGELEPAGRRQHVDAVRPGAAGAERAVGDARGEVGLEADADGVDDEGAVGGPLGRAAKARRDRGAVADLEDGALGERSRGVGGLLLAVVLEGSPEGVE